MVLHYRETASLQKRLLSSYNLEAVKSVAWGINHEEVALKAYTGTSFGAKVEPTGNCYMCTIFFEK